MPELLEKLIDEFGTEMTLRQRDSAVTVRGFLRRSGSQAPESQMCALGEVPRGQYLYLGPAVPMAQAGDILELEGKGYVFRDTEPIRLGDRTLYCRGICRETGGEDTWGKP